MKNLHENLSSEMLQERVRNRIEKSEYLKNKLIEIVEEKAKNKQQSPEDRGNPEYLITPEAIFNRFVKFATKNPSQKDKDLIKSFCIQEKVEIKQDVEVKNSSFGGGMSLHRFAIFGLMFLGRLEGVVAPVSGPVDDCPPGQGQSGGNANCHGARSSAFLLLAQTSPLTHLAQTSLAGIISSSPTLCIDGPMYIRNIRNVCPSGYSAVEASALSSSNSSSQTYTMNDGTLVTTTSRQTTNAQKVNEITTTAEAQKSSAQETQSSNAQIKLTDGQNLELTFNHEVTTTSTTNPTITSSYSIKHSSSDSNQITSGPDHTSSSPQSSSGSAQTSSGSAQTSSGSAQASSGSAQASSGTSQAASEWLKEVSGSPQASSSPQTSSGSAQASSGSAQASSGTSQAASEWLKEVSGPPQTSSGSPQASSGKVTASNTVASSLSRSEEVTTSSSSFGSSSLTYATISATYADMKRESTASNGDRVTSSEVIKAITSSPQDSFSFPVTTTIASERLIETTSPASPSTPLKTTETTEAKIERSEHLTTAKLTTGSYDIESTVRSEVKPGESSTQTISTTSKDSSGRLTHETTYLATTSPTSPQSTSIQMTSGDASSTITITHNEDKSFTISGTKYSSTEFATSPFMQCVGMKSDRREFVEAVLLTIAHRDHQEKFEPRQASSSSSFNSSIGVSAPINFVPGDGAHCVSQTISGITQSTPFPNCGPKRRVLHCVDNAMDSNTFPVIVLASTPVLTPTPTPSPTPLLNEGSDQDTNNIPLIAGVIGGTFALAGFVGVMYFLNKKRNEFQTEVRLEDAGRREVRGAGPAVRIGNGADLVRVP